MHSSSVARFAEIFRRERPLRPYSPDLFSAFNALAFKG